MSESRYDVVRAKSPNGTERNMSRAHAKSTGAEILADKPTHNPATGLPIPGKPRTNLAGQKTPAAPTQKKEA